MFNNIFKNKKVFITGHTGFVGTWIAYWLLQEGAEITGYSLPPIYPEQNHFTKLGIENHIFSLIGDINNYELLNHCIKRSKPHLVIHLAAQALVINSYHDPLYTLKTNIIGTANVLNCCKKINSIKAILNVTTDKCYYNLEQNTGYIESDKLGGDDIYSASKASSEIISHAYRKTYFDKNKYPLLATARAGNIIFGGDWAKNRIITDIINSIQEKKKLIIRNPHAIRPWQCCLDAVYGYLLLCEKLLNNNKECATAYNFGPDTCYTVLDILKLIQEHTYFPYEHISSPVHETNTLLLDSTKAQKELNWKNIYSIYDTVHELIEWYTEYYNDNLITDSQLKKYINKINNIQ